MKALTLHQPWATLIAIGEKRVETRGWPTKYSGPLAIHAAKGLKAYARDFMQTDETFQEVALEHELKIDDLPEGVVVATANLKRCAPITVPGAIALERDQPREYAFGNYSLDEEQRYAFVLDNVVRLAEPIECKGHQQLWPVPAEVKRAIAEQAQASAGAGR